MTNPPAMNQSPFKFLDAYGKEDKDIFFGRDTEVEVLYQTTFQTNLILVYGMSGTGKTSIIRSGLAKCFEQSDWFDLYIRRQENINDAFTRELRLADKSKSFEPGFDLCQMVHSLYLDYLRPIYLLFDQFEELFILGTEDEQQQFVNSVKILLAADLPCKLMFIMREEYIAHLSGFEREVPRLFDKRLRIEPMTRTNARQVILKTAPKFNIDLCYDEIADDIIEKVTEGKGRVQLTYLQVFLDKMYRLAVVRNPQHIEFDIELVAEVGQIQDVLAGFLDEQLAAFAQEVDVRDTAVRLLRRFVSQKGTKVPVSRQQLAQELPELTEVRINIALEFFTRRRILRPIENGQYELAHDSLAAKIFQTQVQGVPLPPLAGSDVLPDNPFVSFEPYTEQQAELFFGRSAEVHDLFDKVINEAKVRTTLVIGPVGVGKTSLVRAGLIPYLKGLCEVQYIPCSREWLDSGSVQQMLNYEPQSGEEPPLLQLAFQWEAQKPSVDTRKVIILDQFEECFIWIKDHTSLTNLFLHIAYTMESRRNVDMVLAVRDEFFSQLQDLEVFVPELLEEQVRLRHVDEHAAAEIIQKTLEHADMKIEDPVVLSSIIKNVKDSDGKINLTYLQLYMDKLYKATHSEV